MVAKRLNWMELNDESTREYERHREYICSDEDLVPRQRKNLLNSFGDQMAKVSSRNAASICCLEKVLNYKLKMMEILLIVK